MPVDGMIDVGIFVASLIAIGVGVGLAVSVPWALVTVGALTLATVFAARMTERVKPQEVAKDEPT